MGISEFFQFLGYALIAEAIVNRISGDRSVAPYDIRVNTQELHLILQGIFFQEPEYFVSDMFICIIHARSPGNIQIPVHQPCILQYHCGGFQFIILIKTKKGWGVPIRFPFEARPHSCFHIVNITALFNKCIQCVL